MAATFYKLANALEKPEELSDHNLAMFEKFINDFVEKEIDIIGKKENKEADNAGEDS